MKNLLFVSVLFMSFSCANPIKKAVNEAKYNAYEMAGIEKRDLFKREITRIKEDQEETTEAFKDALTKLKEIYAFDGGDLEREHDKLNASYENALTKSEGIKDRISRLDTVAGDLFVEWEGEIEEISSMELKSQSRKKLQSTRSRYSGLYKQLKSSEKKLSSPLARLKDQVLYLKHNLNARAISGLKVEGTKIQADIKALMREMDESNRQAEAFIKTL